MNNTLILLLVFLSVSVSLAALSFAAVAYTSDNSPPGLEYTTDELGVGSILRSSTAGSMVPSASMTSLERKVNTLQSAVGSAGEQHMGTFSGSVATSNVSAKSVLQDLESKLDLLTADLSPPVGVDRFYKNVVRVADSPGPLTEWIKVEHSTTSITEQVVSEEKTGLLTGFVSGTEYLVYGRIYNMSGDDIPAEEAMFRQKVGDAAATELHLLDGIPGNGSLNFSFTFTPDAADTQIELLLPNLVGEMRDIHLAITRT